MAKKKRVTAATAPAEVSETEIAALKAELYSLRSENAHLRAMMQILLQSLAEKREKLRRREAGKPASPENVAREDEALALFESRGNDRHSLGMLADRYGRKVSTIRGWLRRAKSRRSRRARYVFR